MLHVTCDLCGKELRPGDDVRYIVKIEVFAALNPAPITEEDLDYDHMEAVSELLCDLDDNPSDALTEPTHSHHRYDLCLECSKKFNRDPLGKEAAQKFDFSEN